MPRFKLIDTGGRGMFTFYNTYQAVCFSAMLWVWATGRAHLLIDLEKLIVWEIAYNHDEIGMHLLDVSSLAISSIEQLTAVS